MAEDPKERQDRAASAGRPEDAQKRAGFVTIVGRPNVGKSTLLNLILGEKIAIVSPKPQTTRNRILGVRTMGPDQIVLLDTPGIHRSRSNLNRFMIQEALDSLSDVDCVLLVVEADPREAKAGARPGAIHPDDLFVLERVIEHLPTPPAAEGAPQALPSLDHLVVVLNKIDRVRDKRSLLPQMALWRDRGHTRIVPICALEGSGLDPLLDEVRSLLPVAPHLYPEDMLTDRAERFLAAELVREQVFLLSHREVPYATAVEVLSFEERPSTKDVVIEAVIHVERDSQRAILVGKGGRVIKQIGTQARLEIAKILGCTVHLRLEVHVERDWSKTPSGRKKLGYE
jgi:GTPase